MSANNPVLCVSCGPAPCNCVGECMEEAHQPAEPVEICRLRPIDLELRLQPPGVAQQVPVPGPDHAMWSADALEEPLPQAQPSVDQAGEMMDTEAGVAPQSFKGPCDWDGSSLKSEGGSTSQAHGQPEVPVPDSAGSGTNSPEQAQAEPDVDRCGVTSTTQPASAAAEQRQAMCRAARAARTEKRKVLRQLQAASLGEGRSGRRRCSTITEETGHGEGKSRESSVSASGGSGSKSPMASERRHSASSQSGSNASAPASEKSSSSGAKESTKSASTGTSDDGKDEFRRAWLEEQQKEYDADFEKHEYQEQEGTRKRKV